MRRPAARPLFPDLINRLLAAAITDKLTGAILDDN
jgi:hypothetical protein